MFATALLALALAQAVLTDAGPARPAGDPDTRHAMISGTTDPGIPTIPGLSCRTFLGYMEDQTAFNLLQGDLACSGERLDKGTGSFREVNYLPTPSGRLPVVIYSPRDRVDAHTRFVMFLSGGPRTLAVVRPLVRQLVGKGYGVLMPIYLGELETKHPAPDLPDAVQQVGALSRWAGRRLVATIGVSAGGYLAAAACSRRCAPRILLAPPLGTPEDVLSPRRVDWAKVHDGFCLWRYNGPHKVCADNRSFVTSFWGSAYYRTSLASLLRPDCGRVRIVTSRDDTRTYDPGGVEALRTAGCQVDVVAGYQHWQIDGDPALNERTIGLLAQLERGRPVE